MQQRRAWQFGLTPAAFIMVSLTGAVAHQPAGRPCHQHGGLLTATLGSVCHAVGGVTTGATDLIEGGTSTIRQAAQDVAAALNSVVQEPGGSGPPGGSGNGPGPGPGSGQAPSPAPSPAPTGPPGPVSPGALPRWAAVGGTGRAAWPDLAPIKLIGGAGRGYGPSAMPPLPRVMPTTRPAAGAAPQAPAGGAGDFQIGLVAALGAFTGVVGGNAVTRLLPRLAARRHR